MKRKYKYPKVIGSWVYAHLTPDYQNIYFGRSKTKQYRNRWNPSYYKGTTLQPFITQYGWDNLIHIVIQDGLTERQAEIIEGVLIKQGKADGWCINDRGSDGWTKDKEKRRQYSKQYYQEHQEKMLEYSKQYQKEHNEKYRQYTKKQRSTPEGKIYHRVSAFNQYHPDKIIETPLEAKRKYLESGYIPDYIKSNDLF